MKRMGIDALYRKPNSSKPAPGHKIYPCLLRKLAVTRPNHVWAMDITYIPMARGCIYPGGQIAEHRIHVDFDCKPDAPFDLYPGNSPVAESCLGLGIPCALQVANATVAAIRYNEYANDAASSRSPDRAPKPREGDRN